MRTYSHVGDGVFQEVLDKLELWDEAMQETAQDVEKELNLHDVVSEEQNKTKQNKTKQNKIYCVDLSAAICQHLTMTNNTLLYKITTQN